MNSHSVRRMHACSVCHRIGLWKAEPLDEIGLLVRHGLRSYAHPSCLALHVLLVLSREELERVRLCDVSKRRMQDILRHFRIQDSSTPLATR